MYLPTEEELRREIETQKMTFYLQQKERQNGEELIRTKKGQGYFIDG